MTLPSSGEYIDGSGPVPPLEGCIRIATNQRGQFPQEPLPNTPGSGTWTGATSGATGLHQQYFYELIQDLSPPDPDVVQQYIIMSGAVGTFVDNEILTPS